VCFGTDCGLVDCCKSGELALAAENMTVKMASNLLMNRLKVQGLGSAGINVLTNVITTDMVELRERGKYMGMTSLSGALGLIAGVIIGSSVAERASWRLQVFLRIYLLS
jgi:MFS family permease